MIKCIALLRKRADLSREDFIAYYETRHAPLVLSLLPGIVEYRRSFVQPGGAFPAADGSPIDFDVITEIWLEDRAAYDRFIAKSAEPDIARQIAEDEEHLFERSASRMVVVEERQWTRQTA